jgi:PAS domain S-box-containing protein
MLKVEPSPLTRIDSEPAADPATSAVGPKATNGQPEAPSQWGRHQMYRYLFENHSEPMWIYDLATLRFLEVNDAAIRRYGYTHEEFLRMTLNDIRTPEQLTPPPNSMTSVHVLSHSGPSVHRAKDGTLIRGEITSQVLSFGNRKARMVMEQDITEKAAHERQLQQAQRLESLGQLAGGVAHDFNNLLAVILNVTALLKTQVQATAEEERRWAGAIRDLERVEKAAQSASRLTKQLLAFARREVVQRSVIDLSEQISVLTELLRRTLGSHIVLTTTLPADLWAVLMDPGHLEQVVINLCVNSRDSMPRGGALSITTANVVLDEVTAEGMQGLKPGRHVRLQVSDSGSGMDQSTLDHAFEPFFTTKGLGLGTGLGLATVYGIVKQVKGHVSIESTLGRGTTVTILIPATDALVPGSGLPRAGHSEPATGTVLVVDDYGDLRELMEEILKNAGYRVLSASDGTAALAVSRDHKGEIDVLLTDIVMPSMLGSDLAEQMKLENPDLRVLFMSGFARPIEGALGTIGPETPLLQKPFMGPELLDKMREVLATPIDKGKAPTPS